VNPKRVENKATRKGGGKGEPRLIGNEIKVSKSSLLKEEVLNNMKKIKHSMAEKGKLRPTAKKGKNIPILTRKSPLNKGLPSESAGKNLGVARGRHTAASWIYDGSSRSGTYGATISLEEKLRRKEIGKAVREEIRQITPPSPQKLHHQTIGSRAGINPRIEME